MTSGVETHSCTTRAPSARPTPRDGRAPLGHVPESSHSSERRAAWGEAQQQSSEVRRPIAVVVSAAAQGAARTRLIGEGGWFVGAWGTGEGVEFVAGGLLDAFGQAHDVGAGVVAAFGGRGFVFGQELLDEAKAAGPCR